MPQPTVMSDSAEPLSLFEGVITPENGFDIVNTAAPVLGTRRSAHVGDNVVVPAVTPFVIAAPYDDCDPVTYSAWFASNNDVVDPLLDVQLHEYATIVKLNVAVPLEFVALIFAVTALPLGAAVYVPTMSAVPAVRFTFASAKPVTFAGAVLTVIAVNGAPLATAIGIVNGTFCNTPAYNPLVHVGVAANAGSAPKTAVTSATELTSASANFTVRDPADRRPDRIATTVPPVAPRAWRAPQNRHTPRRCELPAVGPKPTGAGRKWQSPPGAPAEASRSAELPISTRRSDHHTRHRH